VDVVGSDSLLNEYELVKIIDEVFRRLDLKVVVKINNRKVLAGIAEVIGEPERMVDITVAIDKLEKIGLEKVLAELKDRGVGEQALEALQPVLGMKGTRDERLEFLDSFLARSATGQKGLEEIRTLFGYLSDTNIDAEVEFDMTLARGLNYYTGAIFEVKSAEVEIGSICGGGRYDDLTGIFGLPDVSGVGISFGADRIYDVLEQLERFPARQESDTRILFVNFGERETAFILPVLDALREKGIPSELYPDQAKMKKQMAYANSRQIPYVAMVGEQELSENLITLKDMESGEQKKLSPSEILDFLASE
jgi:histidyl-tRNA synthetase